MKPNARTMHRVADQKQTNLYPKAVPEGVARAFGTRMPIYIFLDAYGENGKKIVTHCLRH